MPELVLDETALPRHIGVIMDGNGRWAEKRNLPRTQGHKAGVEAARTLILAAIKNHIQYLTLYTFSTENWSRPDEEVSFLMNLLRLHLTTEKNFYTKNNIRVLHLGDPTRLSQDLQKAIKSVVEATKDNTAITVVIALNYGGRDEIVRAIKKTHEPAALTEAAFHEYFDLPELPDADLIIRTGGEKRLSNFLLWHGAYAELFFEDTLWPDYSAENLERTLLEYQKRTRRFGGLEADTHEQDR